MLTRSQNVDVIHGFSISVEADDSVSREKIEFAMEGALTWMEGVGKVIISDPPMECFCEYNKKYNQKRT